MATQKEMSASMNRILQLCAKTLKEKNEQYAGSNTDRLLNFKLGEVLNCGGGMQRNRAPYGTLWGYMLKHITSICYMCHMYKQKPSRADWDEKIVDTINYLLILSAMVDEDIKEEQDNDQPERPDSLQGKIAQAKYKKNDRHKKDMTTDKRMTNLIQATIWEEEKEDE